MIEENIRTIREKIAAVSVPGLPKPEVELVCVTKGRTIPEIVTAINAGISIIAENRVQEASLKYETLGKMCKWHMIGHLQTNKAKTAVEIFDVIQSVDSIYLLNEINHYAKRLGKIQEIFIEVKVSDEPSKYGVEFQEFMGFIGDIEARKTDFSNVRVTGLMAMAPFFEEPEKSRPYFKKANEIFLKVKSDYSGPLFCIKYLSMGMTNDYIQAVEEGSNMVRIGTGIFK